MTRMLALSFMEQVISPASPRAPHLLVTSGAVRVVHRPVVLAEKLLAFSFEEVP
jgi:hypothetical protein